LPFLLALAGSAAAAPVLDVRARTRLLIDGVARTGSGVRVRGGLTDASSPEGVSGREVLVTVEGQDATATTGRAGRFDVYVVATGTRVSVAARFAGDDLYAASSFDARVYDAARAQLSLEIEAPGEVDATADTTEAVIVATSEEGPEVVRVALHAGEASGAGVLRDLGVATSDEKGVARVEITRASLGRPGEKRLVARFEGSDSLNPAEAEATFVLATGTQIADLELPDLPIRHERRFAVSARLIDSEGAPVSGAMVGLEHEGRRLHEAVTDGAGRFSLRAAAADLGPGAWTVFVNHRSTFAWRRGTRSGPIPLEIARPRPVPAWVSVAAFSTTLFAVGLYAVLRARPWEALAAMWRARRRRPESAPDQPLSDEEEAPEPGLKLARPGLISTLRRAADHLMSGRVRDLVRGAPVAGARLVLTLGEERLERLTDGNGHFEVELGPGAWRIQISAHGYVTETVTAAVPHRGELRGARIDLLPVRERVFALYREIAAPLLPRPELWGVWTPREILDRVRRERPAGAFAALTDLVEEAYFAKAVADERIIELTRAAVAAARAEAPSPLPAAP
jgi:hypothetical protein